MSPHHVAHISVDIAHVFGYESQEEERIPSVCSDQAHSATRILFDVSHILYTHTRTIHACASQWYLVTNPVLHGPHITHTHTHTHTQILYLCMALTKYYMSACMLGMRACTHKYCMSAWHSPPSRRSRQAYSAMDPLRCSP